MARTKNEPKIPEPTPLPALEEKPSQAENIISIVLGLAVVLVIGSMIFNAIRGRNTQTQEQAKTPETKQEATVSASHTVAAGETLWSIAEKYYNDGSKWTEIQKANNLTTNGTVEVGSTIIIPKIDGVTPAPTQLAQAPSQAPTATIAPTVEPTKEPTQAPSATPMPTKASEQATGSTGPTGSLEVPKGETMSASTDKEYVVKAGDTLWAIAVAKYNNGYKWVDIAKANSLNNPDMIHPGNTFILP